VVFADLQAVQSKERAFKRWRRAWKLEIVKNTNPYWSDLYKKKS
jgi:putative endonuclease